MFDLRIQTKQMQRREMPVESMSLLRKPWSSNCKSNTRILTVPVDPIIPLVLVKPGLFLMGNPDSEESRYIGELRHQVTLTRWFFLSESPCTQAQWQAVMGSNPSCFKGADRPVEMVNWHEAVDFCQRLTKRHQKAGSMPQDWAWRLPTEAEWEYAARAGIPGPRHGELDVIAWHAGNSGGETHPVKQKSPNAWGLHDMIGNVWEWCSDWQDSYSSSAVTDPTGPSSGNIRVRRGGSWGYEAEFCRSAYRSGLVPDAFTNFQGFRPALSTIR